MGQRRSYFGTDGIRGRVGEPPITADFMLRLGWAAGRVLGRRGRGKAVIGKDTRISGYMFESALEAGLSAAGVDILLLGPMPTPAIAYLTRTLHADTGIVISASHNPYQDNGVKFFSRDGNKLPDSVELEIEAELEKPLGTVESAGLGKAERVVDAGGRYIEFCKSTIPYVMSFRELHIVLDCANGATYNVAPAVFSELGARVTTIGTEPDGLNINQGCGSTAPGLLQETVLREGADLGIALDGDGDRVVMVDHRGEIVDGDELLFIIARSRQESGHLQGSVVGTQMSNLGLEQALAARNIPFERVQVGDRYIMERLRANDARIGGESSGHIICLDRTTTGDGIISALQVLAAMLERGETLNELKAEMHKYPQTLVNVPVARRVDLEDGRIRGVVQSVEGRLGDRGRVLLRASGTEPVVRVMVEGQELDEVEALAAEIAAAVQAVAAG